MFIHELSLNYTLLKSEDKSHSGVSGSLWPHGPCSPWNSPGQNPGVSSLSLLQGIFPTHGSNPGLLHCRQILYQLSHKGSPRILEWVACPFSRGSSWHRNWTGVSCIAGGFFTNWAIREAHTHTTFVFSFPLWLNLGYWIQFPVLYSGSLLFIHLDYLSAKVLYWYGRWFYWLANPYVCETNLVVRQNNPSP